MEKNYNKVVGSMVRSLRMSRGVSLRSLAEVLDVQYPSLSKMENGEQKIDVDFLMKLANYFEVPVNDLLNIEGEKSKKSKSYPPTVLVQENRTFKIRETLEHILNTYLASREEQFKGHDMGDFVRNEAKDVIRKEALLNNDRYFVVGSVGQGQWAEVAWISIFLRNITTTATKGYYIVYLFKADMTGVYVSLNQGYTYFRDKYGAREGREKLKKTAALVREKLNTVPEHLRETEINLASSNALGKGYETGHIYGRYYELDSLPSSEEIISDLKALLLAYQEIENLMGGRTIEQFNDNLLLEDDNEFLEENEQEVKYQEKTNEFAVEGTKYDFEEDEQPKERPEPTTDKGGGKRWPRDASVAAAALRLSEYKCSYDENHMSFISKVTGKPFMELHHLVPMSLQEKFIHDLDRVANIKSLCPLCHRAIHHGEDEKKSRMIEKLYKESRDKLEAVGIEITLSDLKMAYGIAK